MWVVEEGEVRVQVRSYGNKEDGRTGVKKWIVHCP